MPFTNGGSIFPEPRSFFWRPINGERHAAEIRDRHLPPDELIGTLCGQQLKPTCPTCWSATAARVGLRA